ncbi:MAG TPA: acyltransferase [Isosphaeraceae bacterium]|nr:acyltransferase [Isosphaeraceae bacterium]
MRRIPELDGLRGLAALTVVVFHLYPTVMPFGWAAVDLFFTLSGFLITGIILEQGDEPRFLRTFYVRRSLRIWPIYYVTIAALLLAGNVSWHCWLPFALYLQNTDFYLMPLEGMREKVFTPDWAMLNHAWSLAVEEQFYLIWPGLVLLAGRRRVRALTFGCLVGSVTARWAGYPSSILITRCDGLALGALLASVLHRPEIASDAARRAATQPWLRAAGAGLTLLSLWLAWGWWEGRIRLPLGFRMDAPPAEVLSVSLIAFVIVALVAVETGHRRLAPLRWKPLRDLGTISYGVYLYHCIVLHSVEAILPHAMPGYRALEGLLTLGFTLAVASLSWRLIERPVLKLKNRFDYRTVPSHTGQRVGPSFPLSLARE